MPEELEPLFDYRRIQPVDLVYLDGNLFLPFWYLNALLILSFLGFLFSPFPFVNLFADDDVLDMPPIFAPKRKRIPSPTVSFSV